MRTRKVKPSELTDMYIGRLKKYDDKLHFFVNLTEERAKKQANDADSEIARGKYRGPLHGIPWGAKDLLAVKGTPTTWGAGLYQNQMFDYDATVVKRLDEAGAILIAKLTLGSLAQGDRWWKERTRNPWNPGNRRERFVGRPRLGDRRGLRRLQHRLGNERLDSLAVAHERHHRLPSVVRPRLARRRDGAVVDDRQARPDVSQRRRLRARVRRDPGSGRSRSLGEGVSVQLGREPQAVDAQDRGAQARTRSSQCRRHDDAERRSQRTRSTFCAASAPSSR